MKRGFIYETVSEQDKKVMTGPAMNGVTSLRMTFEGICVQLVDFFPPFGNHRRSAVCHNKFVKLSIKFSAHSCKPRSTKSVVH